MTDDNKINQIIIDFVKGGDARNLVLFDTVLHKDFKNNKHYLQQSI